MCWRADRDRPARKLERRSGRNVLRLASRNAHSFGFLIHQDAKYCSSLGTRQPLSTRQLRGLSRGSAPKPAAWVHLDTQKRGEVAWPKELTTKQATLETVSPPGSLA